jgi:hypothetical protein
MQQSPQTLILDGLWGSHARWAGLVKRLTREVGPTRILRYNNSGLHRIGGLGKMLARELTQLGGPFHLVAYSMGGLVAREALRLRPDLPLQRAAFLHCPHGGSWAGLFLPLSACRDMMPGSPFLRRLNEAPWNFPTLATWCPFDLMVVPGYSAAWKKAGQIVRINTPAHAWPVFSPGIHQMVAEFLVRREPVLTSYPGTGSPSNPSRV